MGTREEGGRVYRWRSVLRRELSLLLLLKVAALALLWWLFFSPAHRIAVDGASTGRRLALEQSPGSAAKSDAVTPRSGGRLD